MDKTALKVGMKVRLITSELPVMAVEEFGEYNGEFKVRCRWAAGDDIKTELFAPQILRK
jgi:uncharacterized protein YodC (DUF2158 family)